MYSSLCQDIAFTFGLFHDGKLATNAVDVAIMDFKSDLATVEMAWDNWSGFVVTAKSRESEPLIQRISEWFVTRQTEPDK